MYTIIKELSPNLFFILFTVLMYQFWFELKEWPESLKKLGIFIASTAALILCMSYPIRVGDDFIFDLRHIAMLIGGLYGGPFVTTALFIVAVLYRILIGGTGLYVGFIIASIETIIILLLLPQFKIWQPKNRIISLVVLSMIISIIVAVISEIVTPYQVLELNLWIGYIIAYVVGIVLTAGIVEAILYNEIIRSRVLRAEKLEAVSHLAASISHEIRNPLTTSRGFMQLLKEEELPPKWNEYIDISIAEMDRAEGIIRNYLTFAKPAPNEIEIIDIETELLRAIEVMRPLANMNNISITFDFSSANIRGERSHFQQSILNLVKNAIEAMPNGGLLHITSNKQGQNIVIKIKDTGIGMTKEQVSRLGEPYFSTKEGKGTGLGMMVVYRIIEAMDGVIHAESQEGKGTCFTITLPIQEELVENQKDNMKGIVSIQ